MKIVGLNQDSTPIKAENKSLVDALNLVVSSDNRNYQNENSVQGYVCQRNPNKYGKGEPNSQINQICGVIQTDNGFVQFGITNEGYSSIEHYTNLTETIDSPAGVVKYQIENRLFGRNNILRFNPLNAITGDYWYNWKKELIIVFCEGNTEDANSIRIVNMANPFGTSDGSEIDIEITSEQLSFIELNNTFEYPKLNISIQKNGSLKVGAYQIAIAYKNIDGSYTNYSLLSPSIILKSDYANSLKVGDNINKSIFVEFLSNENFTHYKLSLVFITEEATLTYETDEIVLQRENSYSFNSFDILNEITLENVTIRNIVYEKCETLCNFNNRLLIGNLSQNTNSNLDSVLREIVNNLKFDVVGFDLNECTDELYNYSPKSVNIRDIDGGTNARKEITLLEQYFQTNEEYAFYAGFIDNKGNLINIYHAPFIASNCNTKHLEDFRILDYPTIVGTNDDVPCHKIVTVDWNSNNPITKRLRSCRNIIQITIPENINIPNTIRSIVIFYAEHNSTNSRILSEALILRDTETNNAFNQEFKGQFIANNKYRVYPFEYLFTKQRNINCNLSFLDSALNFGSTHPDVPNNTGNGEYYPTPRSIWVARPHERSSTNLWNIAPTSVNLEDLYWNKFWFETDMGRNHIHIADDIIKSTYYGYFEAPIRQCFYSIKNILENQNLIFILNDDSNNSNRAGDSFYRLENDNLQGLFPQHLTTNPFQGSSIGTTRTLHGCIGQMSKLINSIDKLYFDLDNQKLQIASSIIPLHSTSVGYDRNIYPQGDTYVNFLSLRHTTPTTLFSIQGGQVDNTNNEFAYQLYTTFVTESRMCINALVENVGLGAYKLANEIVAPATLISDKIKTALGISYSIDNGINSELYKSYSLVLNENGVEDYSIISDLNNYLYKFPYRLARSAIQNNETKDVQIRNFLANEYIDLPTNRGEIVSIKTNNTYVYIQQLEGLRIAYARDKISVKSEDDLFLGSTDIFDRTPQEIYWSQDGVIACNSKFDCDLNKAGYFVINQRDKKVFHVVGSQALEISSIFMKKYFDNFIIPISRDFISPFKLNSGLYDLNKSINRYLFYDNYNNILKISQGQLNIEDINAPTTTIIHHPAIPAVPPKLIYKGKGWLPIGDLSNHEKILFPADETIGNFIVDPRDGIKYPIITISKDAYKAPSEGDIRGNIIMEDVYLMGVNFRGGNSLVIGNETVGNYYNAKQILSNRIFGWKCDGLGMPVFDRYTFIFDSFLLDYYPDGTAIEVVEKSGSYAATKDSNTETDETLINLDNLKWLYKDGVTATNDWNTSLLPTGFVVVNNNIPTFHLLGKSRPIVRQSTEISDLIDDNTTLFPSVFGGSFDSNEPNFMMDYADELNDYLSNFLLNDNYGITIRYRITNKTIINRPIEQYYFDEDVYDSGTPEIPAWDETIITETSVKSLVKNYETISYNTQLKRWISRHSNIANFAIGFQNNVVYFNSTKDSITDLMFTGFNSINYVDKDNYNFYYDQHGNINHFPTKLKIIVNDNSNISKRLESIVWKDRINNHPDKVKLPLKTISKIGVHNDIQTTGMLDVNVNTRWWDGESGSMKSNSWRFNKLNSVLNNTLYPFFMNFNRIYNGFEYVDTTIDELNFKANLLDDKPKWYNQDKLYDNYVAIILQFDNNSDGSYKWTLEEIDCVFTKNNRSN